MGCNYLSLHLIPPSGTTLLISESEFELTIDTPYLILISELWFISFEYFEKKKQFPCCNGTVLYYWYVHCEHLRISTDSYKQNRKLFNRAGQSDVMIWKPFLHSWPFMKGLHGWSVDFPHQGLIMGMWSIAVSFIVSLNALLNKWWNYRLS